MIPTTKNLLTAAAVELIRSFYRYSETNIFFWKLKSTELWRGPFFVCQVSNKVYLTVQQQSQEKHVYTGTIYGGSYLWGIFDITDVVGSLLQQNRIVIRERS